jgi:DNA replication protein DnaC
VRGSSQDEGVFWVWTKSGKTLKVFKPRRGKVVKDILLKGHFPERYVNLLKGIKETPAINAVKGLSSAFLFGPPGTGKTTAAVWRIAHLVRGLKLSSPYYVSAVDFEPDYVKEVKLNADSVLIDDLNPKVIPEWKLQLLIELVYHAYNKAWKVFITSNDTALNLPQPILSRIADLCGKPLKIAGKDLRLEKFLP